MGFLKFVVAGSDRKFANDSDWSFGAFGVWVCRKNAHMDAGVRIGALKFGTNRTLGKICEDACPRASGVENLIAAGPSKRYVSIIK